MFDSIQCANRIMQNRKSISLNYQIDMSASFKQMSEIPLYASLLPQLVAQHGRRLRGVYQPEVVIIHSDACHDFSTQ